MADRSQQQGQRPTPARYPTAPLPPAGRRLRDMRVIGNDRPDAEPSTAEELHAWDAIDRRLLAEMERTRANAYARCTGRPAASA